MKYFFGTLALIAIIFTHAPVARAANSCPVINPSDGSCCTSASTDSQIAACQNYFDGNNGTDTPVSGQIGGSQKTTAVNSAATNTSVGQTYSANDPAATACSAIKFRTLLDIAIWIKCIIGSVIIPGIFTLAFVVFLWGVLKFMRSSEQKDKQESKQFIYMGLIGLFVMTSVWGIIKIFATTLGIETVVPTLQTTSLDIKNASK